MTNTKLSVVMCLVLLQISCSGPAKLKPHPIFTSTESPPVQTAPPTPAETHGFNEPTAPVVTKTAKPEPEPITRPQPGPQPAAVIALVSDADRHTQAGNLEAAVVNIERALRIKPRDASLTYRLAELRLKQAKPRLAEDLARKSALLAGADTLLKKRCWLLIAEARRLQQNYEGEKAALMKAESLN